MATKNPVENEKGHKRVLVETVLRDVPWPDVANEAARAEDLGFDGIGAAELSRDAFLTCAVAASSTTRIRLATSVAIAFPRSPTVVAYEARNLHDLSGGRFVLGLGTQVKGHIERRFGAVWDSPGPRLREYVEAVRAVWNAWQDGTPLDYRGRFYQLTLMTPDFSPPPSDYPVPRIHVAAVNEYNIRLAGETCDGLRVHPFSTPEYTRDVIWPNIRTGAAKAGRSLAGFELNGTGFIATGPSGDAVQRAREDVRYRLAFYASTRTYLPVLAHHGWEDINPKLRELIAQNRWNELSTAVPDEVLDGFCLSGTYETIVDQVRERLEGLVDTISLSMPDDDADDRFRDVVAGLRRLKGTPAQSGESSMEAGNDA